MRRFAITVALAIALGLGTTGTADAHNGMRSFSPGQSFNMGTVRTFPSFNSSPFLRSQQNFMRSRQFGTNSFGTPNGSNNFNNGFVPPSLFPRGGSNFNGFGMMR